MRFRLLLSLSLSLVLGCSEAEDDSFDGTFAAWGSSTSTVSLLWVPVDGASGYTLERIGGPTVTLGAEQNQYLDRGLAEGRYSYRLTPIAPGAEPQEAEATTSEDLATVTAEDEPIGEAVVATIGSAGGMIELPAGRARAIVPPGALPDGATVTLQEIAAPTGAGDLAIDISSEPAFSGAIELAFALDDATAAIAGKQADGTWTTVGARIENDRAIVSVLPAAETDALAATPPARSRFVRFRRIRIDPDPVMVRGNQERALFAQAVFSDDICQEERHVAFCHLAIGGPRNDAYAPLPSPIVDPRRIRNDLGTWSLGGPGRLEAVPGEHSATYFSPASKPSPDRWPVTFTTRGAIPITATSMIRFIDDVFLIELHHESDSTVIGHGLEANVKDMFYLLARATTDGPFELVGGPYNMPSTVTNLRPLEPYVAAVQTSPFELATITEATVSDYGGNVSVSVKGTKTIAGTIVTLQGGLEQEFTGGSGMIVNGLPFANVPFSEITGEQWFNTITPSPWRMKVAASPGP